MYDYYGAYPTPYFGYLAANTNAKLNQRQEESYIENILRMNIGKVMTIYLTYENNREWNAKVVTGTLRAVGRDYLLLRDRESGKDYLFRMINVDYFVFEEIAFSPPNQRETRR
ncbi:spore coat protein GerQ [Numidum massiliense]|uniref:spore coat protein GerQ n=1 Tax=Numidum massiliense TaxID=1522315 RepID=UPI0006D59890|nr:spore coat protein GerQ [Numidum massiliense]